VARIGIESELPVVTRSGEAASRQKVGALFEWLVDHHRFEPYHDGHTGALVGVRRAEGAGWLDVGTDYGYCTLEVAFPPEESFSNAEVAWEGFLDDVLVPALEAQELSVLGYGCQPKTKAAGRAFVADKGHYEVWTDHMERHPSHAIDGWPSFASLQFNLDVPPAELIPATNAFIKLSPLICAWSANSPVFGGRVEPWLELRAEAYLELARASPFFADRLYFPRRPYASLADYMQDAWAMPLFEVRRDGKVFHPALEGLTTFDFAAAGEAGFVDLAGRRSTLRCTAADLAIALVFAWPSVRVKVGLDDALGVTDILEAVAAGRPEAVLLDGGRRTFIEVRHLPTMSKTESFAWLAMFLGWLADVDACATLVQDWSLDEVKACFDEVLVDGWSAGIAGRSLREWGTEAFAIAHRALTSGGSALELRLEPLRRRLETGTSPATDALAVFGAHGVDALVDHLRLR
jgi:gamma-glutamylcysteine synthetase